MRSFNAGILILFALFAVGANSRSAFAQGECTGVQIFTAKACAGDANSADEKALFEMVNSYRMASKLPPLRLSQSLSIVANRRMLDLRQNLKTLTHSWSDCKYDLSDAKTWHCVTDAPRKLKCGYNGEGYETLYRKTKGKATPALALGEWKKSQLHNSIILNDGMFRTMPWDEVGVAIAGEYAALWFGFPGGSSAPTAGFGYSEAVSGMPNVFTIKQSNGKESAATADNSIVLNISGPNREIGEIFLGLDSGKLNPQTRATASSVLKNLFPNWPDIDGWLDRSTAAIDANQTATRTKIVGKFRIEMSSGGKDALRLRFDRH